MIVVRRQARQLALQVLFQIDQTGHDPAQALADAVEREEPEPAVQDHAERLVRGVVANQAEIDAQLSSRAREWSLGRMAAVDRNILRLGMFELLYCPDVPASVAANEAVELAKAFSTADSGRFVNGILGQLIRERRAEPESPVTVADDAP